MTSKEKVAAIRLRLAPVVANALEPQDDVYDFAIALCQVLSAVVTNLPRNAEENFEFGLRNYAIAMEVLAAQKK